MKTYEAWGVLMGSDNRLDGKREYLAGNLANIPPVNLFNTRDGARDFIKRRYGYIAKRPDLRAEPHGWKIPKAVRVEIRVVKK